MISSKPWTPAPEEQEVVTTERIVWDLLEATPTQAPRPGGTGWTLHTYQLAVVYPGKVLHAWTWTRPTPPSKEERKAIFDAKMDAARRDMDERKNLFP